mgnify:CR=1 FL=1
MFQLFKKKKTTKVTDLKVTKEEQEYLRQLLEAQIIRIEFLKAEKKAPKQLDSDLKIAQKIQSKVDLSFM